MFEIATELECVHAGMSRVRDAMELVSDFLGTNEHRQFTSQYESILDLGMFELDNLMKQVESIHTVLYAMVDEEEEAAK